MYANFNVQRLKLKKLEFSYSLRILPLIAFTLVIIMFLLIFPEYFDNFLKEIVQNWKKLFLEEKNKSQFYSRISKSGTNPERCTKLLRQLGNENDNFIDEPFMYGKKHQFCDRLDFLLDSCLTSNQSESNYINQSNLFLSDRSRIQNYTNNANLLFLTFEGRDILDSHFKESFTAKLLSYFMSAFQRIKSKNSQIVAHTPAYSCQSLISAINLDFNQSNLVVYGPRTFGSHRVLSPAKPNLYILWIKHPFISFYESYLYFYKAISESKVVKRSEYNSSKPNLPQQNLEVNFEFPFEEPFLLSRGNFDEFLQLIRTEDFIFLANPIVKALTNWKFGCNSSQSGSGVETAAAKDDGSNKITSAGLNLKEVTFQRASKSAAQSSPREQIIHPENQCLPADKAALFDVASRNTENYVAYFGSSDNKELHHKSSQLLCAILNLHSNCFGAFRSSNGKSTIATDNSKTPSQSYRKNPENTRSDSDRLESLLNTLSAESIDILSQINAWDLKLYAEVRRKMEYQFQSPLARTLLSGTSFFTD